MQWFRYWPLYEDSRFRTPQRYSNCLNCGRMMRNGSLRTCPVCKSRDVESVLLYSKEQLDFLSSQAGRKLTRFAFKALKDRGWRLSAIEYAYRMSVPDEELKEDTHGPDERVLFSGATGKVLPLCAEPTDDSLFWETESSARPEGGRKSPLLRKGLSETKG